jgi:hypothetical protein
MRAHCQIGVGKNAAADLTVGIDILGAKVNPSYLTSEHEARDRIEWEPRRACEKLIITHPNILNKEPHEGLHNRNKNVL